MMAHSISQPIKGSISCLVANVSDKLVKLRRGDKIGTYENLHYDEGTNEILNLVAKIAPDEFIKIGEGLNEKQINQLKDLLESRRQAFSMNGSIGCTDLVEHKIELLNPDIKPIVEPLRRRPRPHIEETSSQIREMSKDVSSIRGETQMGVYLECESLGS